jgi:Na+-driven multidrug efflux pump
MSFLSYKYLPCALINISTSVYKSKIMKKLLITTTLIELTTGLLLIPFPSVMATLLFGTPIDTPVALTITRVAGVALISMGIACWLARDEKPGKAVKGLVTAMTVYNIGVILVLIYAGIILGLSGIGLWPVVLAHLTMTVWCILSLLKNHSFQE